MVTREFDWVRRDGVLVGMFGVGSVMLPLVLIQGREREVRRKQEKEEPTREQERRGNESSRL